VRVEASAALVRLSAPGAGAGVKGSAKWLHLASKKPGGSVCLAKTQERKFKKELQMCMGDSKQYVYVCM
jgi:hypothetical protein